MKTKKTQAIIYLVIGGVLQFAGREIQKTGSSIGFLVLIIGVVIFAIGVGKLFIKPKP